MRIKVDIKIKLNFKGLNWKKIKIKYITIKKTMNKYDK